MAKKMKYISYFDDSCISSIAPTHIFSLEFAEEYLKDKKVLDVGCWNGSFQYLMNKKKIKCDLVGIDLDDEALNAARKHFPNYKFVNADVHKKLPFKKEFDTVMLWMTFEHLKNEKNALKNINRVVKKNGKIFLSTPSDDPLSIFFDFPAYILGHKHYNPKKIEKILNDTGFKVEESIVVGRVFVALRVSLLIFYKHILRKSLPKMPFVENKQLNEYRSKKGFNEIFIRARKASEA